MSDKITLLLRSRDATSGTSSNFRVSFQTNQYKGKYVRFKRVMLPLSYYNVNDNTNTLVVDIGAGNQSVTLTNGQYGLATSLASEVQTQLQTLDASFTCSYNSTTNKMTIARTGNYTLVLASSTCNELIGFGTTNKTGAATYTSDNIVVLDPNTTITLHANLISSTYEVTDYRSDVSLVIPVTESLGSYVNYYPSISEWFTSTSKQTTVISVELRDVYNRTLELNGAPVDVEVEFSNEMY